MASTDLLPGPEVRALFVCQGSSHQDLVMDLHWGWGEAAPFAAFWLPAIGNPALAAAGGMGKLKPGEGLVRICV